MKNSEQPIIVGIGASAGGVEALSALFDHMPRETGMAFVVVMHFPQEHASQLNQVLQHHTAIPVEIADTRTTLVADRIYVCPADKLAIIEKNRLRLLDHGKDPSRKPIDVFLSSLAEQRGESAVAILLSGSGSDGALGIKAVKEHGGFTMVQGHSETSAPAYESMAQSAHALGVVDLAVPVEEMPARLQHFAESQSGEAGNVDPAAVDRIDFQPIYDALKARVGHDFSGYKQRTIGRRVRRRMQVHQLAKLTDYIALLQSDPTEVNLLFRDLLIGVTDFFRDKEAFEALERDVIPNLFDGKGPSDTVRIWVPGCATGEEVYSIAILILERMGTLSVQPKVQIFATDIDENALSVARAGRYPAPVMENVSEQRRKRFFTGDDASYTVTKDLRDICVFSPHSALRDPPFSRIDLISCRNLLIYLGARFQSQVIPVFHFALRPQGYLFLGTSENVSQFSELFAPIDKKHRIFQRRDHPGTSAKILTFSPPLHRPVMGDPQSPPASMALSLRRTVEARVMERFAPAHVVVNREGDVMHYSARTGRYLEAAPGVPNRHLVAMARRGLRLDLRAVLREAVESHARTERHGIPVEVDDRIQRIDVTVEPLTDDAPDPLFLVVFKDVGTPAPPGQGEATQGDNRVDRLEQELRDTRERLQATIEEYETAVEELKSSNEELQSVNEELQSVNEELQSTNEEMETSKEELQSLNEELHTVNAELSAKVDEVDRANSDLRNVFESTRIATVFLDQNLVIRSFTPAVTEIFNLISTDRGRPLTDIVSNLADGDLRRDVRVVFERGETIERKMHRADGKKDYLMRILPYRGRNAVIEGVLVTFVELPSNIRAQGSAAEISVAAVVAAQISGASAPERRRITLTGADARIPFKTALSLGLAIEALTGHAVATGLLAKPKGAVAIGWKMADGQKLTLTWAESGGTDKTSTKRSAALRALESQLKALKLAPKLKPTPAGLRAEIRLPAAAAAAAKPKR